LTLYPSQEQFVNDLEFCEDLESTETQIEGSGTALVFSSPLFGAKPLVFNITGGPGQPLVPGGGAVSAILIGIFGNFLPIVNTPKFSFGLKFTQTQPNPFLT
jgi:hypothetical protein